MLYLHEAVSMGNKMLCSPDGEQSTQYCKLHALSALFSAFRHKLDDLSEKGASLKRLLSSAELAKCNYVKIILKKTALSVRTPMQVSGRSMVNIEGK